MTNIEKARQLINWLLHESGTTHYQINKDAGVGLATLSRIQNDIKRMDSLQLSSAQKLEAYALQLKKEEMERMENIMKIIEAVEKGIIATEIDYEFIKKEYTDAASDIFITHKVANSDLIVMYAEKNFVKEMREGVYHERVEELELRDMLEGLNGLDDQYDYDKVVAYDVGDGTVWL